MKDDEHKDELSQTPDNAESKPKKISRISKKQLIIAAVVLVVIAILTGGIFAAPYITQTIWKNNTNSKLITSVQNTLNLQQMKFSLSLDVTQSITGQNFSESLKMDGSYKKAAGLSAKAESTLDLNGSKLSRKSQWVIDASDNTYANLATFKSEVKADGPYANIPQANATTQNTTWTKYTTKDIGTAYALYGIHACTLKLFYDTQSQPQTVKDLIAKMASSSKVQQTSSTSETDKYTITVPSNEYGSISNTYMKSDLFKKLVNCDQSINAVSEKTFTNTLKDLTMTISVNKTKQIVSSLSITSKGLFDIRITLSPANDVTITPPSNPVKQQVVENIKITPR